MKSFYIIADSRIKCAFCFVESLFSNPTCPTKAVLVYIIYIYMCALYKPLSLPLTSLPNFVGSKPFFLLFFHVFVAYIA
jgi:hypothetical protein